MLTDELLQNISSIKNVPCYHSCIGEKKYCNPAKSNCQISWFVEDYKGHSIYCISYHKEENRFETGDTYFGFFVPVKLYVPFLKIDIHQRLNEDFFSEFICKKNAAVENKSFGKELYIEIRNSKLIEDIKQNPKLLDYPKAVFKSIPDLYFLLNYNKIDCIDELCNGPLLSVFLRNRKVKNDKEFFQMQEFCKRLIDHLIKQKLIVLN